MNDEKLITHLRDSKGWQNLGNAAADRIEQLSAQLKMVLEREAETHRRHEAREDTIREAALREAAAAAEALAVKWWKEYKDRLSPHCADPQYQGMSDGADDVADAILALIGGKTE